MRVYDVGRNSGGITRVEDSDSPIVIGGALCFYEDGRLVLAFSPHEWLIVKEHDVPDHGQ